MTFESHPHPYTACWLGPAAGSCTNPWGGCHVWTCGMQGDADAAMPKHYRHMQWCIHMRPRNSKAGEQCT